MNKSKIVIITTLLISIILVFANFIMLTKTSNKIPIPKEEHPRLLTTKSDITELRKKINTGELMDVWNALKENCSLYKSDSSYEGVRKSFEANAFIYLIHRNSENGRQAIDLALNILSKKDFNEFNGMSDYDKSNYYGRLMLGAALVYDWCYYLLDNTEKREFINGFEHLAKQLEIGYPPKEVGTVTGHASEAMLMVDMLSAGVATYDENKEMYNLAVERFITKYVPVRKFIYKANMHYQGNSYGPSRFENEIFATWIFDKIGYQYILGKDQGKVPYRWIYTRRPDGQFLRDGDDYFSTGWYNIGQYWEIPEPMLLTYGYFKDPYLKYEFLKEKGYGKQYNHKIIDPLFEILFSDTGVTAKSPNDLPLTKYFASPIGDMVARTGWGMGMNSTSSITEMKIGEYTFNNHSHLDGGSFQIYYKGPLAIDSGVYTDYDSSHDLNYQKRTIAHNSLLVYNPTEIFKANGSPVVNDGGQQWPNNKNEPMDLNDLMKKGYKVAKVLNHSYGPDTIKPDYSYLKGNLKGAYTDKVNAMTRSFVSLNLNNKRFPSALVVFDRVVSSKANYKKYWLLHSVQEPQLSPGTAVINRNTDGYNGRLILKTLLPVKNNLIYNKVGGVGNEFTVFGSNFPSTEATSKTASEAGVWRLEVSPKVPAKTDLFLNVMYVSDANQSKLPEADKIENALLVGTKVMDRIVVFSKTGSTFDKDVSINIKSPYKSLKYLITDAAPGKWCISINGKTMYKQLVSNKIDASLYFVGAPGQIKLDYLGK